MRFAICVTDPYLGVLDAFIRAGWEPEKLFTTLHRNRATIEFAQRLAIDVQFSRMQEDDLKDLERRGCGALVVASYDWRIPGWERYLKYAVNFHPAPLPDGRGPYPIVQALLEDRKSWGVACHKISHEFDSGDILDRENFPVFEHDCHESANLKIQMAAARLAERVAGNLPALWENATPQGEGSYTRLWNDADRTIDFTRRVNDILRQIRAFGLIECIAKLNDKTLFVRRAAGWQEPHLHVPGTLAYSSELNLVIAVQDGYLALVEWSVLDKNAVFGKIGRP